MFFKKISATVEINGKPVKVIGDIIAANIYKRHFKKDLMQALQRHCELEKPEYDEKTATEVAKFVWVFVKRANPLTKKFVSWRKELSKEAILEIFVEISKQFKAGEING